MTSAQGQVQQMNYEATFPILLNISDRPTYFLSLKDNAGLVKMYAFVDVSQYQIVGTGSSVEEARADYISKLKNENLEIEDAAETTVSGIIENIASAVVSGNTNYYIKLVGNDKIYIAPITISDRLPLAKSGDSIEMTISEAENKFTVTKIDFK